MPDIIVASNLVPLIGLSIMLVFVLLNPLFNRKQTILFAVAVIINIVALIAISLDHIFSYAAQPYFWALRRVTSFMNFALSPLIPLLLLKLFEEKKLHFAYYIPAIVNTLLCFVSIFVKIVFFISETNKYSRGVLFFIPIMTSLLYVAILTLKRFSINRQNKRNERIYLFCAIGLLILGIVLEIAAQYLFISWDMTAIILILYYLLLNIHCFVIDPLTGAYNRLLYTRTLESIEKHKNCIVSLIDINNFKAVNDKYGHDAGDRFLVDFAQLLYRNFASFATIYRIGGDEFVIISKHANLTKFNKFMAKAKQEAQFKNISFAYGTVAYDKSDSIQSTMKKVDALMYENKALIKAQTALLREDEMSGF